MHNDRRNVIVVLGVSGGIANDRAGTVYSREQDDNAHNSEDHSHTSKKKSIDVDLMPSFLRNFNSAAIRRLRTGILTRFRRAHPCLS